MLRAGAFLLFAICAGAQTPYDLVRDLTSHPAAQWESIWKTWGVPDKETPDCDDRIRQCTLDLITISKPSQVILVLQSPASDHYLQFRESVANWRYAGSANTFKKNYGGRYEIERIGEKPFLKISSQGASGSNWDSEWERWFDLSSEKFEPCFDFTPRGWEGRMGFGVSRDIRASAGQGSYGEIELDVEIRFSIFHESDLGFARYKAHYTRASNQPKFTLHSIEPFGGSARPLSNQDFKDLVNFYTEDGPREALLVSLAMPRLKQIASGTDSDARKSLKESIQFWKDTPAKREILALIDHP